MRTWILNCQWSDLPVLDGINLRRLIEMIEYCYGLRTVGQWANITMWAKGFSYLLTKPVHFGCFPEMISNRDCSPIELLAEVATAMASDKAWRIWHHHHRTILEVASVDRMWFANMAGQFASRVKSIQAIEASYWIEVGWSALRLGKTRGWRHGRLHWKGHLSYLIYMPKTW